MLLGDGEVMADGPAREVMSGSLAFSSQVSKLFPDSGLLTVEDLAVVSDERNVSSGRWRTH